MKIIPKTQTKVMQFSPTSRDQESIPLTTLQHVAKAQMCKVMYNKHHCDGQKLVFIGLILN